MGGTYDDEFCQSSRCDEEVRNKARELKQALVDQTLKDIDSWVKAMQAEYDKAHPDRSNDTVIGDGSGWVMRRDTTGQYERLIPEAELERYRTAVRTEHYEWVVPAFERCLTPAPQDSDPALKVLGDLKGAFQGKSDGSGSFTLTSDSMDRIQQARSAMNEWQGDLQLSFDTNFISPLLRVSFGQGHVAQAAYDIFEQNKKLYTEYRRKTLELLDKSIAAVRALQHGKNPQSHVFLTLVGISIGTALSIVSAGVGAAVIISSTMAQSYSPPAPKEVELGAPTAQEVAFNINQALNANDGQLYESERAIKDAFQNCHDQISSARSGSAGALTVPTPDICTASPGEITDGSLRPDRVMIP